MQSRSDKMFLVALRVFHALKMALLVTGVAMGSAALWYLVNAPDGRETTALLSDLKEGPVFITSMGINDWQMICLVPEGGSPNEELVAAGAGRSSKCDGWNGSMKYFPGFGAIAISGQNSCKITPVFIEQLIPAEEEEVLCSSRRGLMSLHLTGAEPPYGLELHQK